MPAQNSQPQQLDVIPVNGWLMSLDPINVKSGMISLISPHFHKVSGLSKKTGSMEVVDGGTNAKIHFSDGIREHGDVTISRSRDGTVDDQAFSRFIDTCFESGGKVSGTMTQYRYGRQVMEIRFTGLLFNEYNLADFDTQGSDKSDQSYTAKCDKWECVFT